MDLKVTIRTKWQRTPTLSGHTTHSTLGGVARRFHLLAITAMQSYGRSEWDISFGVLMPPAGYSETRIGANRLDGMKKRDYPDIVKESFARAWLMFSNGVPI